MRSLIAAAAIAAASATPYDYPAVGAFPGYLCNFQLNDALMNTYNFDLRQIAGQQPSFVIPNTYNYTFGVCGVAGPACTTNNQIWSLAAGYQIPFNSGACEVLSVGPPLHSLADSSNAATGGIQTTFAGAWTTNADGMKCNDVDPVRGKELGRSMVIHHSCNPNMPPGQANVTAPVAEQPQCTYHFYIESSAACGTKAATAVAQPPSTMPAWLPGAGPMANYLCKPNITDSAGKNYAFNLQQLYNPTTDYTGTDAAGNKYAFNVCGYTTTTCTPEYSVEANFGGLVAFWANGQAPAPTATCRWANGTDAACTTPCRTLGEGAPFITLTDPTNAPTGGVTMTLQGELTYGDEPMQYQTCAQDGNGDPIPASVTFNLACDQSTPATTLSGITITSSAPGTCAYTVSAKTAAACGA